MELCICDGSLSNGSDASCVSIMKAQKKLIILPYYNSAGVINYIDLEATLNSAYFSGKINSADLSVRWRVLPDMKNVTDEKGESVFEEFDDNTKAFIKEGVRNFTGLIIKGSTPLLGALKSYRCDTVGVFIIDLDGSIIGSVSADGTKLNPIMLESPSIDAKLSKSTDATIQKIMFGFQFHISEKDENLRLITSEDLTNVYPLTFAGLLTAKSSYSSIGLTSTVVKLFVENGGAITKHPITGLLIGDFALFNKTDSASVTITSVTETVNGTYTIVYPAQGATEVLRLTPTVTGVDFAAVVANLITLP